MCFKLLQAHTKPYAPQTLRFLDCTVFNILIGNHDAHAKNYSILYTDKGPILAPLCDTVSTAIYPRLTNKMAMKVGRKYEFSR